jgi:hypothetical protein
MSFFLGVVVLYSYGMWYRRVARRLGPQFVYRAIALLVRWVWRRSVWALRGAR